MFTPPKGPIALVAEDFAELADPVVEETVTDEVAVAVPGRHCE